MDRITHHHRPDLYDLFGDDHAADVAFYTDLAVATEGEVLEIGVGTGRTVLPAVRRGATVTGLDLDEAMLAALRAKLEHEPEAVRERLTLRHGDARTLDLEGFTLVTLPFHALNYIPSADDRRRVLERCFAALQPGGRIAFNTIRHPQPRLDAIAGPMAGLWRLVGQKKEPGTDATIMLSVAARFDPRTQIQHSRLRFEWVAPDGQLVQTVLQDSQLCQIPAGELVAVLDAIGFVDITQAGGFAEELVAPHGPLVVQARRP